MEDFLFVDTNMTVSPVVMAAWISASGDNKVNDGGICLKKDDSP